MAIVSMDNTVAALARTSGTNTVQRMPFVFPSVATKAAYVYHSLWRSIGNPGESVTPATGAGAVPTNATGTANSRFRWANPTSANTYLGRFCATLTGGNSPVNFLLYDRLWHNSGLSTTNLGVQTINSSALTRPDANGDDTELWVECYSATGWTGTTFAPTVSYTNSSGTSGRTATIYIPSATQQPPIVGTMYPMQLQQGDTGVRSVQSITVNASQAGGDFGLVILRRVVDLYAFSPSGSDKDFFDTGGPQIYDSAALALMCMADGSSAGYISGAITLIQG